MADCVLIWKYAFQRDYDHNVQSYCTVYIKDSGRGSRVLVYLGGFYPNSNNILQLKLCQHRG